MLALVVYTSSHSPLTLDARKLFGFGFNASSVRARASTRALSASSASTPRDKPDMASKSARLAEARCRSPSSSSVDDDSFVAFVRGVKFLRDRLNCEPCFAKRRDDNEDEDEDDALVEHGSSARRVNISDDRSASVSKVFHLAPRRATLRANESSSYLERGEVGTRSSSASNHLILFFTKK